MRDRKGILGNTTAAQASKTSGKLRRWGQEVAVVSSNGIHIRMRWVVKVPVTMWSASLFWSFRSYIDHVCRSRHATVRDAEQLPGLPGMSSNQPSCHLSLPATVSTRGPGSSAGRADLRKGGRMCPMEHPSEMEDAVVHQPG